jgi:hypothetical protein
MPVAHNITSSVNDNLKCNSTSSSARHNTKDVVTPAKYAMPGYICGEYESLCRSPSFRTLYRPCVGSVITYQWTVAVLSDELIAAGPAHVLSAVLGLTVCAGVATAAGEHTSVTLVPARVRTVLRQLQQAIIVELLQNKCGRKRW